MDVLGGTQSIVDVATQLLYSENCSLHPVTNIQSLMNTVSVDDVLEFRRVCGIQGDGGWYDWWNPGELVKNYLLEFEKSCKQVSKGYGASCLLNKYNLLIRNYYFTNKPSYFAKYLQGVFVRTQAIKNPYFLEILHEQFVGCYDPAVRYLEILEMWVKWMFSKVSYIPVFCGLLKQIDPQSHTNLLNITLESIDGSATKSPIYAFCEVCDPGIVYKTVLSTNPNYYYDKRLMKYALANAYHVPIVDGGFCGLYFKKAFFALWYLTVQEAVKIITLTFGFADYVVVSKIITEFRILLARGNNTHHI